MNRNGLGFRSHNSQNSRSNLLSDPSNFENPDGTFALNEHDDERSVNNGGSGEADGSGSSEEYEVRRRRDRRRSRSRDRESRRSAAE